jgi:hypothetical protein
VIEVTTGFELVIGFIEQLHVVNTSNYSAIANSQALQVTTANTCESFQLAVLTSFLVMATKGGSSPSSGFLNYPDALAISF